jgi:hypothetical protein
MSGPATGTQGGCFDVAVAAVQVASDLVLSTRVSEERLE